MTENHIIPTIFATSKIEFHKRFKKLIKSSKNLQIDFMDGKFVSNKSISINQSPNLRNYSNNFEAHLMVKNPDRYIDTLKQRGFSKIIFHYESIRNKNEIISLISQIKSSKMKAFMAVNPETSIVRIKEFLDYLDGILLMGVHPGKEHQRFLTSTYSRIKQVKKISKKILIQIDGGVNFESAKKLAKLRVNYLNSGSLIAESENPKKTIKELNKYFP